MKKKQSSVEWLQATELQRDLTLGDWNKAKAMHRKEIEDAYNAVIIDENGGLLDGKEYYKETFGGQDNE